MMKKMIVALLAGAALFLFAACGKPAAVQSSEDPALSEKENETVAPATDEDVPTEESVEDPTEATAIAPTETGSKIVKPEDLWGDYRFDLTDLSGDKLVEMISTESTTEQEKKFFMGKGAVVAKKTLDAYTLSFVPFGESSPKDGILCFVVDVEKYRESIINLYQAACDYFAGLSMEEAAEMYEMTVEEMQAAIDQTDYFSFSDLVKAEFESRITTLKNASVKDLLESSYEPLEDGKYYTAVGCKYKRADLLVLDNLSYSYKDVSIQFDGNVMEIRNDVLSSTFFKMPVDLLEGMKLVKTGKTISDQLKELTE